MTRIIAARHHRRMSEWTEIADHVFVRRHASYDVNVGLIVGAEHCTVIDTRASLREGTELAAAVRTVTALPGIVVNTHAHFDHFLGNAAFPAAPIWASRRCAEVVARDGITQRDAVTDGPDDVHATPVVVPTHTFTTAARLDLGGRTAQLCFPGRGHTDNDIVVTVSDADVTFAGDLVEEGAPPAFEDAYPLDWPATVDVLVKTARPGPVVPGHGAVVDWAFVRDQRELLARVAAAGRTGDWRPVGLPDDVAAIARARCEWQLASVPEQG
jgi:glyoxylase-like metal-dependent hydrolase (beta-lactamase superfamily II)